MLKFNTSRNQSLMMGNGNLSDSGGLVRTLSFPIRRIVISADVKRSSENFRRDRNFQPSRGPSENLQISSLGVVKLSSSQNAGAGYCHE